MKKKQIQMTQAKIARMQSDVADEVLEKAILIVLLACHDEFGFGEARLVRLLTRINRYCSHLTKHYIELRAVQEMLEKATGLTFSKGGFNGTDHKG